MKQESRQEHNPIEASSDDTSRKARRLAPLEEHAAKNLRSSSKNVGVISVDTGNLNVPVEFTEREDKNHILGLEPVALVILIFSLAFIALIIYFISTEPANKQPEPVPSGQTQYTNPARDNPGPDHAFSG